MSEPPVHLVPRPAELKQMPRAERPGDYISLHVMPGVSASLTLQQAYRLARDIIVLVHGEKAPEVQQ